jgi:hypothetical protein
MLCGSVNPSPFYLVLASYEKFEKLTVNGPSHNHSDADVT